MLHEVWSSSPEPRGWLIVPDDAVAVQHEASSVVLEAAEPAADALDVLDGRVDRFGASVARAAEGMPGQHLVSPAADGAGKPAHLGDVAV